MKDLALVKVLLEEASGGPGLYERASGKTRAYTSQFSAAMDRVEADLGVHIMERATKRRVSKLTPAGEALRAFLPGFLSTWEKAKLKIRKTGKDIDGQTGPGAK